MTEAGRPVGHPADLLELLHQVDLVVQPAGSVGQHERDLPGVGVLHGVEDDSARVAPFVAPHEAGASPLRPQLQLVGRSRPERVASGEDHPPAFALLTHRHLADRGRLAHPVDPDEQPHGRRPGRGPVQLTLPFQATDQLFAQSLNQLLRGSQTVAPGSLLEAREQLVGRQDADIGQHQGLLELVPCLLVDLAPPADPCQLVREQRPRLAETVPEPRPFEHLRRLLGHRGFLECQVRFNPRRCGLRRLLGGSVLARRVLARRTLPGWMLARGVLAGWVEGRRLRAGGQRWLRGATRRGR